MDKVKTPKLKMEWIKPCENHLSKKSLGTNHD